MRLTTIEKIKIVLCLINTTRGIFKKENLPMDIF